MYVSVCVCVCVCVCVFVCKCVSVISSVGNACLTCCVSAHLRTYEAHALKAAVEQKENKYKLYAFNVTSFLIPLSLSPSLPPTSYTPATPGSVSVPI